MTVVVFSLLSFNFILFFTHCYRDFSVVRQESLRLQKKLRVERRVRSLVSFSSKHPAFLLTVILGIYALSGSIFAGRVFANFGLNFFHFASAQDYVTIFLQWRIFSFMLVIFFWFSIFGNLVRKSTTAFTIH
jgi:hypothetical protein